MTKHKIFVTRKIPGKGIEMLSQTFHVKVWPNEYPPQKEEIIEWIHGVSGILCMLSDKIDSEVMDNAGDNLRVISNYAVGFDNIDIAEATRRGIVVTNTPDVLTETTADLAFALLLAVARRVVEGSSYVRDGKWKFFSPCLLLGYDVYGATLGIIGAGRIGRAVARRGKGFGMRVLLYSRKGPPDPSIGEWCNDLYYVLRQSDFISLHVPYVRETHHLIDEKAFTCMKPNAILVNTARGAVVDTNALVNALKDGRIAGAGLDVCDPEPIPPDHPLLQFSNCVILPHIGSASIVTREKMASICADNIIAVLEGRAPPNPVNPEVILKGILG